MSLQWKPLLNGSSFITQRWMQRETLSTQIPTGENPNSLAWVHQAFTSLPCILLQHHFLPDPPCVSIPQPHQTICQMGWASRNLSLECPSLPWLQSYTRLNSSFTWPFTPLVWDVPFFVPLCTYKYFRISTCNSSSSLAICMSNCPSGSKFFEEQGHIFIFSWLLNIFLIYK